MSHVARYEFESKSQTRVSRVLEVLSVDLVVRPATTSTLFESTQQGCVPWSVEEALKYIRYPEYMNAPWSPHQALEALDDTGGEFGSYWRMASPTYNPNWDPADALAGLYFN